MSNFSLIVVFIGTLVLLLSFILAFRLRRNDSIPIYFKFFYWIPFTALLVSVNVITGIYYGRFTQSMFYVQHIFFLSEFTITCLFFYIILNQKRKLVVITFVIALLIIGIFLLINTSNRGLYQLYSLAGFTIFILCLYYYYQLFDATAAPILDLLKTPTFWIITGLFFFSAITLPLFAIQDYFIYKFGYKVGGYITAFANIVVIIKHLFFIKAYRCTRQEDKI